MHPVPYIFDVEIYRNREIGPRTYQVSTLVEHVHTLGILAAMAPPLIAYRR
jgi:hypothetical protein